MKKLILLTLFFFSVNATFAQTEKAKAMYAEATNGKIDVKEYLQRDFSAVDSISMHDLAVLFYNAEDYESAGTCWEKALSKVQKHGKVYEKILSYLSLVYDEDVSLEKFEWLLNLVNEHNEHELKKECNDYKCKLERAQYYMMKGDEVKGKALFMESLKLCTKEEERIEVDQAFANELFNIRDFEGAAQYYYSAAKRWKGLGNKERYGDNLYLSALNYSLSQRYDVSETYSCEAAKLFENDLTEKGRMKYLKALNSWGDALYCQQKYQETFDVYKQELNVSEQSMPNSEMHADALQNIGKAEVRLKRMDDAKKHLQQACDLYQSLNLHSKYSAAYTELLVCMRKAGDHDTADMMEIESENNRKKISENLLESELSKLGIIKEQISGEIYTNSLNTIAECYFSLNKYEKAAQYFAQYTNTLRETLREKFLLLTESDRKRIWEEQQQNIDEYRFDLACLPNSETHLMPLFIPILYDMELISKGIMLNSVIEFEKVLAQKGDKKLLKVYQQIKKNQERIDELQASTSDSNIQQALGLKQENTTLSQQLMNGCAAFKDYTHYLSYTWRDVQKSLGEEDVAIEFTTVENSPLDKDNYILALILTSTGEPTMSVVSTKEMLKKLESKEDLYDNGLYYNYFWGFLQKQLNGKKRVFFSPDNNLSNIAIEYLNDGQQTFYEKYEVYRLSSTKELCRNYSERSDDKTITIFGNIDYNTDVVAEKKGTTFGNLLYGEEEIKGIKSFMKKKYEVKIYDRNKATELQFRKVSDETPTILHISSHGNYIGDDKTSEMDAMDNSILALSGANIWVEDTTNDGIITAADIAQMNLQQCDMAVLSACNTGLGGKGDDGIFGLQRGFKNAGVHTLLMSLKPVYDDCTAKLMVAFYQGIVSGKSKRESLLDAQKAVKAMGYTEGKYWAPFILLDGLSL